MLAETIIPLFGLFVYRSNISVPLTGVNYDVNINGFASQININQTYKNTEATDIECVYGFPINDYASITGFVVKIDDRIITSQFKKKDEAFKEYSDAIKRGDGAYLLDQSDRSDDTFVLSVGRLPPQKECTVSISYVATLEFPSERKLRLVVPTALYPRYNPDKAAVSSQGVATENKEAGNSTKPGVNPPEVYRSTVPYKATLKAAINMFSDIQNVTSPSHPISVRIQNSSNVIVSFGAVEQPLDRDLIIEIGVESVPEHSVQVEQTGPNEFAAMYSYVPKFESGKDNIKAELIFVLDCSGSMDEEDKIGSARQALKLFLRSIPEGTYFNFYRFGSNYQSLFEQSAIYNAESFAKADKYADESSANLGGTEMLPPLKKIFESLPRSGYARQLLVLTDGEVTNTNEVIDLVKHNSYNTRVFSFGLGRSPSRSLVNGIAVAGNGKSEFIIEGEALQDKIGHQLNRALQPAVVDAAVGWEGIGAVIQVPSDMPPVYRGERQLAFAVFKQSSAAQRDGKKAAVLKIGGEKFRTQFVLPQSNSLDYQQMILKLAARARIKDLENRPTEKQLQGPTGSLQDRNQEPGQSNSSDSVAEKITEISLSYGVLSRYVSLVAVEKRENSTNGTAGPMQLREIPVQKAEFSRPSSWGGARRHPSQTVIGSGGSRWMSSGSRSSGRGGSRAGSRGSLSSSSRGTSYGSSGSWSSNPNNKVVSAYPDVANTGFSGSLSSMSYNAAPGPVDDVGFSGFSTRFSTLMATSTSRSTMLTRNGSSLTTLINKQQWDGSWKFDQELENITGVSLSQMSNATTTPLDTDALSTLLVVEFIKEKYPNESNVWKLLVEKALVFVGKKVPSTIQLDAEILAVKNLIRKP